VNQRVKELLKTKFGGVKSVSGGGYRVVCPTCDPKNAKKMKRYINPGWAQSNCFVCDEAIPLEQLLGENVKFERREDGLDDDEENKYAKSLPYNSAVKLSEIQDKMHPVIQFMLKDHLGNFDYYDSLGIRYIPMNGGINIHFDNSSFVVNTAESLFLPVFSKDNNFAGWQLRFIPGTWNGDRFQFMRYMHLFNKGKHLFNYAFAKNYPSVVVVEGVKKALKLANAVATLGKGISETQKQLIQEWRHITLILDGEDSTQELARDIQYEFIQNGRNCVNIDLRKYGYDSPDETPTEVLQTIIKTEHDEARRSPK
jgi:hypothetical protein